MRLFRLSNLLPLLLLLACSGPGRINKTTGSTTANLNKHIGYLADDKLEGRRTGTKGEELAMDYIISQFKEIGLQPKGTEYYPQVFEVNDGKMMGDVTALAINGNKIEKEKSFFVFPYSANMEVIADVPFKNEDDSAPWLWDLKTVLEENKSNPHFDLKDHIYTNSKKAIDRGAKAVLIYNSSESNDSLSFNPKDKSETLKGVVAYIEKNEALKYFTGDAGMLHIELRSVLQEKKRVGHNVIAYIDNKGATTVILGAHYDHLGYGEDGNSRSTSHEPAIHNGADDNASGTAALIELARMLKTSKAKSNNYLFIAFSGEELGLFGSKYFTEHPTIDLKRVNYMINMDMVGRLNDSTKVLTVGGYGTSPAWGEYYQPIKTVINKNSLLNPSIVFKFDSSGTGPSDHTSFYRKDIPVLFYFTGLHTDYHKPTDGADKINYNGEAKILQHILSMIQSLDKQPKLVFTKTRETQTTTSVRFSVSMGIMPDYTYAGTGVKADGVTDGKPAQKAGLKAGDIIIQLGDYNISTLENYMQALGKFKKGDRAKVKYKRGTEILETEVEF